jgi:pimeloyl-ACP methyl ester carboxylesterase
MAALTVIRRRLLALGLVLAAAAPRVAAAQADSLAPRELVVVAHGMGRSPMSMWPIKKALEAEGYEVLNFGYSSYCCSIAEIGEKLRAELARTIGPQHTQVHFVGHSLGNIVIRYVLTRDTLPPRVGRVVMLAPPNQGAHAANTFAPFAGWLLRPVSELRADTAATVRKLPRVRDVQIGVIAARDDRTVKLPETHLAEETAHVVVGGGHSFIMRREDVKRQLVAFLRSGRFVAEHEVVAAP